MIFTSNGIIDPDDNKFIDCYVAAYADYLVTNDNHFNVLQQIVSHQLIVFNW